jgi:hypothetical protein
MVLELNAIDKCREVEQETRCCVLPVGWWVGLEELEVEVENVACARA